MADETVHDPWKYTNYPGDHDCEHKYDIIRMPKGPDGPSWRPCNKCGKQTDYKEAKEPPTEEEIRKRNEENEWLKEYDPLIAGSRAMHRAYDNIKNRGKTKKL